MDSVLAVLDRVYEAKRHEWDGSQFVTLDYIRREILRAAAEPEAKAPPIECCCTKGRTLHWRDPAWVCGDCDRPVLFPAPAPRQATNDGAP